MPHLTRPEQRARHKSTAIEYQKRVETTRRLILRGMDTDDILQNITAEYEVKVRMARHYIAAARKKNQAWVDFNEDDLLSEHIAHRRDLRRRAAAAGDLKAELATARDEAQLIGLYAAQKMDVTMKDWREAARAQGLTDADIEAATEQAATLFEKIATGQAVAVVQVGEAKESGE